MLDKHLYITSTGVSKTSASATFQWCTIEPEYVLCTHTLSLKSCTAVCCSLCLDFDSLYKQTVIWSEQCVQGELPKKVLNTGQLHTVTMAAHISTHAPIKLGELQKNSIAVLSAVNIDVHWLIIMHHLLLKIFRLECCVLMLWMIREMLQIGNSGDLKEFEKISVTANRVSSAILRQKRSNKMKPTKKSP